MEERLSKADMHGPIANSPVLFIPDSLIAHLYIIEIYIRFLAKSVIIPRLLFHLIRGSYGGINQTSDLVHNKPFYRYLDLDHV